MKQIKYQIQNAPLPPLSPPPPCTKASTFKMLLILAQNVFFNKPIKWNI